VKEPNAERKDLAQRVAAPILFLAKLLAWDREAWRWVFFRRQDEMERRIEQHRRWSAQQRREARAYPGAFLDLVNDLDEDHRTHFLQVGAVMPTGTIQAVHHRVPGGNVFKDCVYDSTDNQPDHGPVTGTTSN